MPPRRTGSAFMYCRVWLEDPIQQGNPRSLSFRTMAGPCLFLCAFQYFIDDRSKAVSAGTYDIITTVCHYHSPLRPHLTYLKDLETVHSVLDSDPLTGNTYEGTLSGFPHVELRGDIVSVCFLIKVSLHILIRTIS